MLLPANTRTLQNGTEKQDIIVTFWLEEVVNIIVTLYKDVVETSLTSM